MNSKTLIFQVLSNKVHSKNTELDSKNMFKSFFDIAGYEKVGKTIIDILRGVLCKLKKETSWYV